jgi:hypothetical protein
VAVVKENSIYYPAVLICFNDDSETKPIILSDQHDETQAIAMRVATNIIESLFSNCQTESIIHIPCFSPSALSVSL